MDWQRLGTMIGLAMVLGLAAGPAAGKSAGEIFEKMCRNVAQQRTDMDQAVSRIDGMNLDDAKWLMVRMMPETYPGPASAVPDDDARAMMERLKLETVTLPRVLSSFCGMHARHTLPVPETAFPEHGELSVSGGYQAPDAIPGNGEAAVPANRCPRPFQLRLTLGADGRDDLLAYVFCEVDGDFVLTAAYATDRGDPPQWRALEQRRQ